jgi:hypothetical protein
MRTKRTSPGSQNRRQLSSAVSRARWATSRRPRLAAACHAPADLRKAVRGDPDAVVFETADGAYGAVSSHDWPTIAARPARLTRRGYLDCCRVLMQDLLCSPPAGWVVHHRNGCRRDNRARNLQVLRADRHTLLHAALRSGMMAGLSQAGERWRAYYQQRDARRPFGTFRSWQIAVCVRDDFLRESGRGEFGVFDDAILASDVRAFLIARRGRTVGFTFVTRDGGRVKARSGIPRARAVDPAEAEARVTQCLGG